MGVIRYAHEYEMATRQGEVKVFAGHPCYCQVSEPHKVHRFVYSFRLRDGSSVKGAYVCDGTAHDYPIRYMDQEMKDAST